MSRFTGIAPRAPNAPMYGSGAAPAGHDIRGHANMTPTGRVQINAYLDVNHYEESKMKKNPLYSGGSAGDVLTYSAFANEMALRRRYRQRSILGGRINMREYMVITVLNGTGNMNDKVEDVEQEFEFAGFIRAKLEYSPDHSLTFILVLVRGGTQTVTNTGPHTICVGDPLAWQLPRGDESSWRPWLKNQLGSMEEGKHPCRILPWLVPLATLPISDIRRQIFKRVPETTDQGFRARSHLDESAVAVSRVVRYWMAVGAVLFELSRDGQPGTDLHRARLMHLNNNLDASATYDRFLIDIFNDFGLLDNSPGNPNQSNATVTDANDREVPLAMFAVQHIASENGASRDFDLVRQGIDPVSQKQLAIIRNLQGEANDDLFTAVDHSAAALNRQGVGIALTSAESGQRLNIQFGQSKTR